MSTTTEKPKTVPLDHYRVLIVEYATGKIEKTMDGGTTERRAERLESGVNRNLNQERYYTLLLDPGEEWSP